MKRKTGLVTGGTKEKPQQPGTQDQSEGDGKPGRQKPAQTQQPLKKVPNRRHMASQNEIEKAIRMFDKPPSLYQIKEKLAEYNICPNEDKLKKVIESGRGTRFYPHSNGGWALELEEK